jgi:hypothetical protein
MIKGDYTLPKNVSTQFARSEIKYLSNWDEAISKAKARIKEIKRSIRTFESLRDQGMAFPKPKKKKASG